MRDLTPEETEAIVQALADVMPKEDMGVYEFRAVFRAGREFERAKNAERVADRVERLNKLTESMRLEIGAIKGGTHGA